MDQVAVRKSKRLNGKRQTADPTQTEYRGYIWDKKRALEKKLVSCVTDIKISHAQKYQNHIYDKSAGMYELYRSEVVRFYDCIPEKSNLKAVFKNICDAENSVVETQIKLHQKTQRGCGHLKFILNLHHTASRMMANGKHIETFLADHKKIVENIMCLDAVESLDRMLQEAIKSQLDCMTHSSYSSISQSSHANNLFLRLQSHLLPYLVQQQVKIHCGMMTASLVVLLTIALPAK